MVVRARALAADNPGHRRECRLHPDSGLRGCTVQTLFARSRRADRRRLGLLWEGVRSHDVVARLTRVSPPRRVARTRFGDVDVSELVQPCLAFVASYLIRRG